MAKTPIEIACKSVNVAALLEEQPREAVKALLKHNLTTCAALEGQILKEIKGKPIVDADGRLDKLLAQDLIKIQGAILEHSKLLLQLEKEEEARPMRTVGQETSKRRKGGKRTASMADLVLEAESIDTLD